MVIVSPDAMTKLAARRHCLACNRTRVCLAQAEGSGRREATRRIDENDPNIRQRMEERVAPSRALYKFD